MPHLSPVPDPNFPFLVHFTRMARGGVGRPQCGASPARRMGKKSGYSFGELMGVSLPGQGFSVWPEKYWRTGLYEMYRSFQRMRSPGHCRNCFREITSSDLVEVQACGHKLVLMMVGWLMIL